MFVRPLFLGKGNSWVVSRNKTWTSCFGVIVYRKPVKLRALFAPKTIFAFVHPRPLVALQLAKVRFLAVWAFQIWTLGHICRLAYGASPDWAQQRVFRKQVLFSSYTVAPRIVAYPDLLWVAHRSSMSSSMISGAGVKTGKLGGVLETFFRPHFLHSCRFGFRVYFAPQP